MNHRCLTHIAASVSFGSLLNIGTIPDIERGLTAVGVQIFLLNVETVVLAYCGFGGVLKRQRAVQLFVHLLGYAFLSARRGKYVA